MPNYHINIIVDGKDNASGPLRGVNSALGSMANIAGGIVGAQVLTNIWNGISGIASSAISATAQLQNMQVGMEGLIAREIAQSAAAEAAATGAESSIKNIGDALPLATGRAAELMGELEKIAISSPYQLETINSTFRQAMAFGFTTDAAKSYTKALLNVASGTGATNDMMGRMAYNLAQIQLQGEITGVDMRQLAMAGFDLGGVIEFAGKKFGVAMTTHEDFNKALKAGKFTMTDFFTAFEEYADANFGGAAERMSRTLTGLQSTFADLFTLTLPKIIGPAVEEFTAFAGGILNSFLRIRDSGLLEEFQKKFSKSFAGVLKTAKPLAMAFTGFFDLLASGVSPAKAMSVTLGRLFMPAQKKQIMDAVSAFTGFVDSIKEIVAWITPFAVKLWDFIAGFVQLKDVLAAIGVVIAAAVIPAFLSFAAALAPFVALIGIIALLRTAWEQNWGGIQEKLAAVWAYIQPLLTQLYTWLQVNIPIALAWLATQWTTVLLPALQLAWAWIQTNLLPLFGQLYNWLQINIPVALAWLATQWTTVLLPAIQTVANWIQTNVVPVLQTIWNWLQVNIPQAIAWLAERWKALTDSIDLALNFILPLFVAFSHVLIELRELALEALYNFWKIYLEPAFIGLGQLLQKIFGPIIASVMKGVNDFIADLTRLRDWFTKIEGGLDGIKNALSMATDWLNNLADAIDSLSLPDWLTPGSPTPFEMGIRGITSALKDLNRASLPEFRDGLAMAGAGAGGGAGMAQPVQINVTAQVSNDVDVEVMAYKLAQIIRERR